MPDESKPTATPAAPVTTPEQPAPATPAAPAHQTREDLQKAALEALTGPTPVDGAAPPPSNSLAKPEVKAPPPAAEPAKPVKPDEAKADPLKRRFEDLVHERADIRRKSEELAAKEAKYGPVQKALEAKDPVGALQALGFSYTDATAQVMHQIDEKPETPRERTLREQVEGLAKQLEEQNAQAKAAVDAQGKAADLQAIHDYAVKAGEKFEFVPATKSEPLVYAAVMEYKKQHGEWFGGTPQAAVEEALTHVNALLAEQAEAILQTQWGKSRVLAVAPKLEVPKPQANPATPTKPKTLTSALAGSAPPKVLNGKPSREELHAQAMDLLNAAR